MKVLQLGGNGNLGSRVIPALLAHNHAVVAYVRSPQKLRDILPQSVVERITIIQGDSLDTDAVADALRQNNCDALVNTSGTRQPRGQEQNLGKIVASVTSAAIQVGKDRGRPVRAWIIGGMSSLKYPGTPYQIQDYMPASLIGHQRGVEEAVKDLSTSDVQWSLLCVAMMSPAHEKVQALAEPRKHNFLLQSGTPPAWQDHWIRYVPFIGVYLNLVPTISSYTTKLEDVADLIAEDLSKQKSEWVGEFVGFKAPKEEKSA
ncbi:hypothetical protein PRZ48_009240 [Zasmidium cellare]|uniref:NAD(P)-binding domain-containing protein n=1 Tax=Zasmidium cellare TaxID=395010 RepID=A0ABR0EBS2_ZASCE|nr:hypothetical protein PRZ48_009240 [Zasmidium cellare]